MKIGYARVSTRDQTLETQLDRLAHSTAELLRISESLIEKKAGLQSLDEPWADTTSPSGKMILTVFGGIAEIERDLISEHTKEGLARALATFHTCIGNLAGLYGGSCRLVFVISIRRRWTGWPGRSAPAV